MNEIETKQKECEFCGVKENCNNYWLGKEDARKEFLEKIDIIYTNRRFVTGNIVSQQKEEEAYRKGWISCFEKIKQSLEEKS